jgi:hypothetical protein
MQEMSALTGSSAYWKRDGKPVFVFWNDTILPGGRGSKADWQALRDQVDPQHTQFWLGGGINFALLDVFDALHFYDITWEASSGKAMSSYNRKLADYNESRHQQTVCWLLSCPATTIAATATATTKTVLTAIITASGWENARAYGAQIAIVTSWNEWFGGECY